MANGQLDIFERILQTAKSVLPEDVGSGVKENLKTAIQEVISDLDIVTREELDTQSKVLQKTREKVDRLEKIIDELEKEV